MVIVIGLVHTVMGLVIWLSDETATATSAEHVWFTAFGVIAIGLGIAIVELERSRGFVPPAVLAAIVAVMLYGVILVGPASGFVSLLIPIGFGVYGWLRRRHRLARAA
ncbi:hypothetical protein SAMN04489812_5689 [Microlunatus soli]|uniref:Low temperature requirement A protein (LtrA) n=2 Tax=Microlunatus soli TaxID=630515 RepID=A0A1H2A5V4_9ACTN|nr:hypothetical protein SAMN04489812_5689 [Microlunatus soli]